MKADIISFQTMYDVPVCVCVCVCVGGGGGCPKHLPDLAAQLYVLSSSGHRLHTEEFFPLIPVSSYSAMGQKSWFQTTMIFFSGGKFMKYNELSDK